MPKPSVLSRGEMRNIDPMPLCKYFGSVEESTQDLCTVARFQSLIHEAARKGVRAEGRLATIRAGSETVAHPGIGTKMIAWPQFDPPRDRGIMCGLGTELPLEGNGWSRVRSSPARFAMAWIAVRSC